MKKLDQYGLRKDEEWEWLPWWPPETRPPFKIRTKPEDIAPFFFVEHHPYALSLLLKIGDRPVPKSKCRMLRASYILE